MKYQQIVIEAGGKSTYCYPIDSYEFTINA